MAPPLVAGVGIAATAMTGRAAILAFEAGPPPTLRRLALLCSQTKASLL
jgi:hypothetical protein